MIFHFVKRDFLDFLHWWVLLLAVTVLLTGLPYVLGKQAFLPATMVALFWLYFMFAALPEAMILGSVWRSQHLLSRHYLLSLPLPHKTLFRGLQFRMLVFWLPLLLLSILTTLIFFTNSHLPFPGPKFWLLFFLGMFVSVGLIIHDNIWSTLETERIVSYLAKRERTWAYFRLYTVVGISFIVLWLGWGSLVASYVPSVVLPFVGTRLNFILNHNGAWIFIGGLVVLVFLGRHNQRRWCVTLESSG
jgi:hypothetical protein